MKTAASSTSPSTRLKAWLPHSSGAFHHSANTCHAETTHFEKGRARAVSGEGAPPGRRRLSLSPAGFQSRPAGSGSGLLWGLRPRQGDPQGGIRLPAAGLGHLAGGAEVFQEDLGQVSEPGAGRQGEAQHALDHGQGRQLGVAARAGRAQAHERSHGGQHGLLAGAGQAVDDEGDAPRLQDVFPVGPVGAQVAEAAWGRASGL